MGSLYLIRARTVRISPRFEMHSTMHWSLTDSKSKELDARQDIRISRSKTPVD